MLRRRGVIAYGRTRACVVRAVRNLVNLNLRDKAAWGGAAGLLILALAFAYRWRGEDAPAPGADESAQVSADYEAAAERVRAEAIARAAAVEAAPPQAAVATLPTTVPEQAPDTAPIPEVAAVALDAKAQATLDDALLRASAAAEAGRLVLPPDDSAAYWYEAALEVDPTNARALDGVQRALQLPFEQADLALDDGNARPANELLAAVADQPRAAVPAATLALRLQQLPQVEALLAEGAQRMVAGQRFEPDGSSALDSYRAAQALDPRNRAASQGLAEIEVLVLEGALAAASLDEFADAERLLALAGAIVPGSQRQLATRTRIVELQQRRAEGLIDRAAMALDARDVERAAEMLARAEALGAAPEAIGSLRQRVADARTYDHFGPGESFEDPFADRSGSGPSMVVVPIGEFTMGSADSERGRKSSEGPRRNVTIGNAFALARTEVTVAQFRRFATGASYRTDAEQRGDSSYYDEASGRMSVGKGVDWRMDFNGEPARDRDPVVHVSWNDADAYAQWLTQVTGKAYRLPSEAEFEYALRAGSEGRYWWGDRSPARVLGNFTGDGDHSRSKRSWTRGFTRYADGHWGPAPAATYAANPFGLHDLDGNLSEWVADCWHDSYLRAPEDGSAWVNKGCERRVVRGGSWGSAPDQIRSAYRVASRPDVRSARIGFRVARDL
jgi:formylglycine-generating enzyme required for sulfatase activity